MRDTTGTTSRMARPTVAPFHVFRKARESSALRSTRIREPAGVPYTALCRRRSSFDGHNAVWGSLGNRVSEKRATATKKAVETPGGGRCRPRMTFATRHRRAASRSGGATSAERDGRPVKRRNGPRGAAAERGFPQGAWRSQAPLKRSRKASGRGATGGRQAPLPWAPGARGGLRRCRCR
jgi:hypothetical protein